MVDQLLAALAGQQQSGAVLHQQVQFAQIAQQGQEVIAAHGVKGSVFHQRLPQPGGADAASFRHHGQDLLHQRRGVQALCLRLQPALLDRLTDNEPESRVEAREARVLTKSQLRAAVLRDLASLMNSTRLGASEDLAAYPEVERSVLNYGMPAFAGETASTLDVNDLESGIRTAILRFEPRILANTLQVEAIATDSVLGWHNVVSVKISAQVWAQPVPLELLLRTEVDLETGQVALAEVMN